MARFFLHEGISLGIEFLVDILLGIVLSALGLPPWIAMIVAPLTVRVIMIGLKKLIGVNFKKHLYISLIALYIWYQTKK